MSNDCLYRVADWVSFRSYLTCTSNSRTLIFNEQAREYILLDGPSSDIWHYIAQSLPIPRHLFEDQSAAAIFMQELMDANLIYVTEPDLGNLNIYSATKQSDVVAYEDIEDAKFESEMSDWVYANGYLFTAHWEITYRCNEVCQHCFNPGAAHSIDEIPKRERDELTTAEAYALLDDMVQAGVFFLTISGGEATLRKDIIEILTYARQKGLAVTLFTNGLRLTDDFIKKIKPLWLHSVEISVYSSNPKIHDGITRVPGSHAKSTLALKKLVSAGILATMKSVQMSHTVQGYQLTEEFGHSLGVKVEVESMISPSVDQKLAPLQHNISFEEMVVLASTDGSPLFVGDGRNNWGKKDLNKAKSQAVCAAGRKRLNVDPEGNITPCSVMPKSVGSVRSSGFYQAWSNSKDKKQTLAADYKKTPTEISKEDFLKFWQKVTLSSFEECGTHERCAWCHGMCPGDALLQTGNPLAAAASHCRESTARMTAAKMLGDGLTRSDICIKFNVPHDFGRQYDQRQTYPMFQLKRID